MDSTRRPRGTVLAALVFLFGIEMTRVHVASLGWYQRDTLGVGAIDLIPIAVLPFAAGFVLPLASRFLSLRASLWLGTVVLVAARIATQLLGDPALIHWTSGVGVAAFVGLLVLLLGLGRRVLVSGVLLGIVVDAAIKAQGLTLDLTYRPGTLPIVLVAVIAVAILLLLLTAEMGPRAGPRLLPAISLLGIGPFLFAQYLILQSTGWLSARTGIPAIWVGVAIVLLGLIALWLATRADRRPVVALLAVVVVAAALASAEGPAVLFGVLVVIAIPLTGPLWAAIVPETDGTSLGPATVVLVTGSVLFLLVGFAYYLPLDLDIGVSQAQARITGAALLLLVGVPSALRRRTDEPATVQPASALAILLLILPMSAFLGDSSPDPAPTDPPLRVMAYNIHQAFGTAGDMDVDAIADVILDSGATVVGLQEIPRGGLLNAGTDVLTLLGDRLGWEHVAYHGTTDPVWGNAILSRYPISDVERTLLPREGTPFQRGYLAATVDSPLGEVLFITTHLQHMNVAADHAIDPEADLLPVHTAQLDVVLQQWAGRHPAVLTGDLNARPDWQQVQELLTAGWVDSWDEAGEGPGYTANAADPQYRIDYVFHTTDLQTVAVELIESQASDHFAVVTDVAPDG